MSDGSSIAQAALGLVQTIGFAIPMKYGGPVGACIAAGIQFVLGTFFHPPPDPEVEAQKEALQAVLQFDQDLSNQIRSLGTELETLFKIQLFAELAGDLDGVRDYCRRMQKHTLDLDYGDLTSGDGNKFAASVDDDTWKHVEDGALDVTLPNCTTYVVFSKVRENPEQPAHSIQLALYAASLDLTMCQLGIALEFLQATAKCSNAVKGWMTRNHDADGSKYDDTLNEVLLQTGADAAATAALQATAAAAHDNLPLPPAEDMVGSPYADTMLDHLPEMCAYAYPILRDAIDLLNRANGDPGGPGDQVTLHAGSGQTWVWTATSDANPAGSDSMAFDDLRTATLGTELFKGQLHYRTRAELLVHIADQAVDAAVIADCTQTYNTLFSKLQGLMTPADFTAWQKQDHKYTPQLLTAPLVPAGGGTP